MHYHNDAAQEFAHIGAMVSQLEQIVQNEHIGRQATVVTLPDYWRARIKAIANPPPELQPQVRALLARLDAIEAANQYRPGCDRDSDTAGTLGMK